MKIVVIGRHGQLARSLAERVVGDIELMIIGRPVVDLAVPGSVGAAVREAQPDLVVNAAAYTAVDEAEDHPDLAFRINADAAGEVAAAAADIGATIIQISTDYVFDGMAKEPYSEEAPTNPLGVYGRSKLAGEGQVKAANPDHLILRTAWVYSPFGSNFVKTMLRLAEQRDELSVVADQVGSPTCALELADAVMVAAQRIASRQGLPVGCTFHVAGSGCASWHDLAVGTLTASAELGGPFAEVRKITTADWPTKAVRPPNSMLDCTGFAREFAYRAPDWRTSLTAVVERLVKSPVAAR